MARANKLAKQHLPWLGIVRVSDLGGRDVSDESFQTEDEQRRVSEGFAAMHGREIDEWEVMIDVPGYDNPEHRRILEHHIERIEAGELGGIVAYNMSRFGRYAGDAIQNMNRINKAGGVFAAPGPPLSVENISAQGMVMANLMAVLVDMEWQRLAQQWHTTASNALERGVYISSQVPVGYLREQGRLVIDDQTAPAIREIFEQRAEGKGWTTIAERLNKHRELRLPWTRASAKAWIEKNPGHELSERARETYGFRGGPTDETVALFEAELGDQRPRWSKTTVTRVVANPVYRGATHYGDPDSDRPYPLLFEREGTHEAIVSAQLWQAANARAGSTPERRGEIARTVFSRGLAICNGCGYPMQVGATTIGGKRVGQLHCMKRRGTGVCPASTSMVSSYLDGYVQQEIHRYLIRQSLGAKLTQPAEDESESLRKQLELVQGELRFLQTPENRTLMSEEIWREQMTDFREREKAILISLEETQRAISVLGATRIKADEVWPHLTLDERRSIAKTLISAVRVSKPPSGRKPRGPVGVGERVEIVWRVPLEDGDAAGVEAA